MQWDYRIFDKTFATVQTVAKGAHGFKAEAEWTYVTFDIADNLHLQAGACEIHFKVLFTWLTL